MAKNENDTKKESIGNAVLRDSFSLTPTTSGSKTPPTKPAKPTTNSSESNSGKNSNNSESSES